MVALRLRLSYLAAAVAYTPGRERETTSLLPPDGGDGAADTKAVGQCNLCTRSFTFILATGRSGSTSQLETLNSLPGVNLRGENHASLWAAYELYRRTMAPGPSESDYTAFEHGALSARQLLCTLQDFFIAFDPPMNTPGGGGAPALPIRMHGFKELVLPAALAQMSNATDDSKNPEHLGVGDGVAEDDEWFEFLAAASPLGGGL